MSTLAEARHYAKAGFRDIAYAVPIAIQRLEEAAELSRSLAALHLLSSIKKRHSEKWKHALGRSDSSSPPT